MYEMLHKILALAIAEEKVAREVYAKVLAQSRSAEVRAVIRELMEDEERHQWELERKYRLHGGKPMPSGAVSEKAMGIPDTLPVDDLRAMLTFAIEQEERAEARYREALAYTHDPILQQFLLYLADNERDHAVRLREILARQPRRPPDQTGGLPADDSLDDELDVVTTKD